MPKTDTAERERRVSIVAGWIAECKSYRDIFRLTTEKKWNVSSRTVDAYIADARKLTRKIFEGSLEDQLSEICNRLESIAQLALKGQDVFNAMGEVVGKKPELHIARQCIMDKAKLVGLGTEKVDLTISHDRDLDDEDDDVLLTAATLVPDPKRVH